MRQRTHQSHAILYFGDLFVSLIYSVIHIDIFNDDDAGIQGRRMCGHVSFRVGARPCQFIECSGLQGAASERIRGAILRIDRQTESSAGY